MKSRWRLLTAKITDWVCTGLIPLLSALRAAFPKPPQPVGILNSILVDLSLYFVWVIGVLGLLAISARIAAEVLDSQAKGRLRAILDVLRDACFPEATDHQRHHNRVTIFKPSDWGKSLKPFCRSGTQFQKCGTSLAINDNDEAANEGAAGRAWFTGATVVLNNPPAPADLWNNGDDRCRAYAEAVFLPVEKAAKLRIKSMSLLATPIRDSKGNRWGVVVVDSRTQDVMTPELKRFVELTAASMSKML